jgi:hypothetical protein
MKSMVEAYRKKKYADGGGVNQQATNRGDPTKGVSEAGQAVRGGDYRQAKIHHAQTMSEAKTESRITRQGGRQNLANGGEVADSSPCAEHGMASCQTCTMDDDGTPDRPSNVTGGYAEGGMIDRIMAKRWPKEAEDMDTEDGEMAHEPDGPSVEDPEPEDEDDDMIGRIMKKRLAGK